MNRYTLEELKEGMQVRRDFAVTTTIIEDFARISGDYNPVHMDDEYARSRSFEGRVAHGMLTASFLSTVIHTELPGEGSIYLEQSLRYLEPVYPGDMVTVEVTVNSVYLDKGYVDLSTDCYNQRGDKVVTGSARVRPGAASEGE